MKIAVVLLALVAIVAAYHDEAMINQINSNTKATWKAAKQSRWEGMDLSAIKRLMGTKVPKENKPLLASNEKVDLPANFDSRTQWPNCTTIKTIRDQKCCGSCWAFGAVESFEDRYCIETGKSILMSPEYLTACDQGSNGCFGGEPSQAWEFIAQQGLPTADCQPYTPPSGPEPCTNFKQTPQCTSNACTGNGTFTKYFAKGVYSPGCSWMGCNSDKMAADMVKNGPFEVAFTVYADFLQYSTGVYQHTSGKALGGHAVKIIGFGTEQGTPYWLVANSWSTRWAGFGGYFKIARGQNECGIENGASAGFAKV